MKKNPDFIKKQRELKKKTEQIPGKQKSEGTFNFMKRKLFGGKKEPEKMEPNPEA